MRIVSWNVNGLRAVFKKGFLDIFNSLQADIFCIQEIKAHLEQLPEELHTLNKDFTGHFFSAQRKGYSGVAVYAKDRPLSIIRGTDKEEFDREGRVITLEYPDFYIINCYAPNAQAELARIDYKTAFNDNLKEFLKKLKTNKAVILCGDLNVAHQPIDLKNPKTNEHNPGYSREEREKFTQLLAAGFPLS